MRRLLRAAEEEPVLVILLAVFAVLFLAIFPPHLLVNDSFLTLAAGREVFENGLPETDELTVLGALARGLSNDEIAKEFWVAPQTVKFHLTNIYRKLGVKNRTEATRLAYQHGLVESPIYADE